jgi:hypothetical protein
LVSEILSTTSIFAVFQISNLGVVGSIPTGPRIFSSTYIIKMRKRKTTVVDLWSMSSKTEKLVAKKPNDFLRRQVKILVKPELESGVRSRANSISE